VPESEIATGDALLAMLMLPLTAPVADGANITFSVVLCCGVSVTPELTPLVLNPDPDTLTPEITMFEFPPFVRVTLCTLFFATFTLPKLRLFELEFSM